jgi:hypothetical protein
MPARSLLAAAALTLVLGSFAHAQPPSEPHVTEVYAVVIKPADLARRWPERHEFPKAIPDLAQLVMPWPWGSIGHFRMPGTRFNDYWVEGGADLYDQFGMFLNLPDGTDIALWYHDGVVAGAEPVVEIGSEGALNVLAPNLKSFLIDWAEGRGQLDLAFDDSGEYEDLTPEILAERKRIRAEFLTFARAIPDAPPGVPPPDLQKFIDAYGDRSRAAIKADPILLEIAKVLDAHIPRGKEVWESTSFMLAAAGSRIEVQTSFLPPDYTERAPLPEREALIPLIAKAREARAAGKHASRGLWHRADLKLYADGHAELRADWESPPSFLDGSTATKAELEADLARFPRGPRWREPWMDDVK